MNWHKLSSSEVAEELKSNTEGLTSEEAQARLVKFGNNELIDSRSKYKIWRILWKKTLSSTCPVDNGMTFHPYTGC
jgi:magnesium-transporting ATPase (P-type)